MITEDSQSENEGKKLESPEISQENNTEKTEIAAEASEKVEIISEIITEEKLPSEEVKSEEKVETISEKMTEPEKSAKKPQQNEENEFASIASLTLPEVLNEMGNIVNQDNASTQYKKFNALKEQANLIIHKETEDKKKEFEATENLNETFQFTHPSSSKFSSIIHFFKEKQDHFHKNQELDQQKNLENRQKIIDKLKNLYTNSEPGVNIFKEIRSIKEAWQNAGQVAKSDFKLLNNNYFHHLNQFYTMLDMNKEYMTQEYAHNLEKRQHIIERAKELENEPVIQKALNELQYLHKLWKEEAEPVAEEFREKTWDIFKEISNKIHDRKGELSTIIDSEQNENLAKKNQIIEEIKKISAPEKEPNHNYWQNAITKIEDLRSEFLKIGSVPRKISSQNWNDFKLNLRDFNLKKNDFYKNLKGSQQTNFEEKQKLIQSAKDNMLSEDWEIVVPLFKKLQDDWKKIGHVPRSQANKMWDDFRGACNIFFDNFREKSNTSADNWKENLKKKNELLEALKLISNEEGSVAQIESIKTSWNTIGKVPKENLTINTEFNKTLREKLKLNKINEFDLKEEGLSENQITDKARKIKNQIADLEAEISKLENNLGFFSNSSRENPLLKDTYENIDGKKSLLDSLKQNLHTIIAGE